jgi:hypothetical protein
VIGEGFVLVVGDANNLFDYCAWFYWTSKLLVVVVEFIFQRFQILMLLFPMRTQIVVLLSIVVSISFVKRHQLCNKSSRTYHSQIKEHIFWIFLKDCTKKLE